MKTRATALFAGLALGGSLLFASAGLVGAVTPSTGPAGKGVCATQFATAQSGKTLAEFKAFGDCEINRRFTTLSDLTLKIDASKVMTGSDKSTLKAEIVSTTAGLTGLKVTIDADTTIPAVRLDIAKIAAQFRVYLLVVPQVHLTNAADGVLSAQTKFSDINTKLAARIAAAKAAGKDTTAAQADLDAMNAAVTAAVGLASPLPGQLLPLTPAQYNGGTAGPILTAARTALTTARNDLKSAVADAKACRTALKALGF
jgi:hypothetical protein